MQDICEGGYERLLEEYLKQIEDLYLVSDGQDQLYCFGREIHRSGLLDLFLYLIQIKSSVTIFNTIILFISNMMYGNADLILELVSKNILKNILRFIGELQFCL